MSTSSRCHRCKVIDGLIDEAVSQMNRVPPDSRKTPARYRVDIDCKNGPMRNITREKYICSAVGSLCIESDNREVITYTDVNDIRNDIEVGPPDR